MFGANIMVLSGLKLIDKFVMKLHDLITYIVFLMLDLPNLMIVLSTVILIFLVLWLLMFVRDGTLITKCFVSV